MGIAICDSTPPPRGGASPRGGAIPKGDGVSCAICCAGASDAAVRAFRSIRPESSLVVEVPPPPPLLAASEGDVGAGADAVSALSEKSTLDSLRAPVPPAEAEDAEEPAGGAGSRALVVTSCSLPAVSTTTRTSRRSNLGCHLCVRLRAPRSGRPRVSTPRVQLPDSRCRSSGSDSPGPGRRQEPRPRS